MNFGRKRTEENVNKFYVAAENGQHYEGYLKYSKEDVNVKRKFVKTGIRSEAHTTCLNKTNDIMIAHNRCYIAIVTMSFYVVS